MFGSSLICTIWSVFSARIISSTCLISQPWRTGGLQGDCTGSWWWERCPGESLAVMVVINLCILTPMYCRHKPVDACQGGLLHTLSNPEPQNISITWSCTSPRLISLKCNEGVHLPDSYTTNVLKIYPLPEVSRFWQYIHYFVNDGSGNVYVADNMDNQLV